MMNAPLPTMLRPAPPAVLGVKTPRRLLSLNIKRGLLEAGELKHLGQAQEGVCLRGFRRSTNKLRLGNGHEGPRGFAADDPAVRRRRRSKIARPFLRPSPDGVQERAGLANLYSQGRNGPKAPGGTPVQTVVQTVNRQ